MGPSLHLSLHVQQEGGRPQALRGRVLFHHSITCCHHTQVEGHTDPWLARCGGSMYYYVHGCWARAEDPRNRTLADLHMFTYLVPPDPSEHKCFGAAAVKLKVCSVHLCRHDSLHLLMSFSWTLCLADVCLADVCLADLCLLRCGKQLLIESAPYGQVRLHSMSMTLMT